eukprot:CAMPEP_0183342898 /NCGR_PEP_ID=MMETSP0164_2-20130417/8916_1 /TAXON_ID=221442 /ORGANISM="Coccolithus pelagicus ssp braarudi, Strain PLY182g" /LENGTH=92 /DNA_ID=CAMNT_0025513609 /DNA_START=162 /DNA_END=436 /DNA_ORIENTATION=-
MKAQSHRQVIVKCQKEQQAIVLAINKHGKGSPQLRKALEQYEVCKNVHSWDGANETDADALLQREKWARCASTKGLEHPECDELFAYYRKAL